MITSKIYRLSKKLADASMFLTIYKLKIQTRFVVDGYFMFNKFIHTGKLLLVILK